MPPFFSSKSKKGLERTETFDSTSTMSTASFSSGNSRPTSRNYDTGFPDWFATHTTSLRHPDAITTPGASISAEDLDPSKALRRSKQSLMAKHRRTLSHGKIAPEPNQNQGQHLTETNLDHAGDVQDAHQVLRDRKDSTTDGSDVLSWDPDVPMESTEHPEEDTRSHRSSTNPFKRWRHR